MHFKKQNRLILFVTLVGSLTAARPLLAQVAAIAPPVEQLNKAFGNSDKAAFMAPAKVYYPETWFHFIGGNVSKKGITADLEAIAAAGTAGVTLFHGQFGGQWPGVDTQITCLSPLWEDAVKHAATEARRLGLRFSMQNCPGWAMAGGPWIAPVDAMRQLAWSRKDVVGGKGNLKLQLAMPQPSTEPWRDYKDITVLAFPKPLDDTGEPLKVASVKSEVGNPLEELLMKKSDKAVTFNPAEGNKPNSFEVNFPAEVVVRTIELPSITTFNYPWSYEPAAKIEVEAVLADGKTMQLLKRDIPSSNFQDNVPLTLAALKDVKTRKIRVSITNKYAFKLEYIRFLSAARQNNWEAQAGWVLRSLGPTGQQYNQAAKAYVDPMQVKDISSFMDAKGLLQWQAPAGDWTILRIGHVNAGKKNGPAPPEGTGWECDKLSQKGANAHFAGYIGHLSGKDGPLKDGLLSGMLMDSWECETQTWTGDMENEFMRGAGYPLRKWMPALMGYVMKDEDVTFRFLHDWKSVINGLVSNNFYGRMATLAKQNGLAISYETAAGDVFPADIMEYFKHADVPMCEFWQPFSNGFVGSLNFKPIKPTTSAARLYGKPRVAAEAFTSFDLTWDEQWQALKEVANVNMVEGVTHLVYHTYTHNPQTNFLPPGTSFGSGIGTPFLRQQTWWKHMPYLNTYFARCSYLLERGKPVSDVLWYLGDEIDHKPDQNAPFPVGFKYDYCNPDVLLNRLSVKDGAIITPEGISYKVLWLPQTTHMLPQTLEKINTLLQAGATVVGNAPQSIVSLSGGAKAQQRFDAAVKSIWGDKKAKGRRSVGRGIVIAGLDLQAALKELSLKPDVIADSALWIHRKTEGADWYFISAPKGKAYKGDITFRNTGNAELWDPVTGTTKAVGTVEKDGRTTVTLDLAQGGSCFVVFNHNGKVETVVESVNNAPNTVTEIANNWTLEFPTGWAAPASLHIDSLKAWKDLDISPEAKAFSGTASYTTRFDAGKLNGDGSYQLNLGTVAMIARVTLNGKDVGMVWAPPYQVDISKAIVSGTNILKVEVTSTWFNRLVYDANQPEDKRKTWTIEGPAKDKPLRASGLLGPVSVTSWKE